MKYQRTKNSQKQSKMCRLTLQSPDVVVYASSASIWKLEAGGLLRLGGQPGLHSKFHATMAT